MNYKVGLIKCGQYHAPSIREALEKSLSAIDFDTKPLKGKTILLKPNMLGAYPPQMGITTHPAFLEAVIILLKDLGCKIWVGDSPNGIFPLDCVWERTGIREICRRYGAEEKVFEREGTVKKNGIFVARSVLDADHIINLPRFKTHGLTVLTIAVKNLYGCVPGLQKTVYHRQNIDRTKFALLVVRIADLVRPSLNIVDAITAMEGNGPSAGKLIDMNTIIVGTNAHAVDAACANLINLDPLAVDTLEAAQKLGLWDRNDKIEFTGEPIDNCRPVSFELPKTFTKGMRDWRISLFVINHIWGNISIKPRVNKKKCVRCGLCVKACPVDAIDIKEKDFVIEDCDGTPERLSSIPRVVNDKCIMCYCCHEVCPNKAIDLNESLGVRIGRFLGERRIKKLKET